MLMLNLITSTQKFTADLKTENKLYYLSAYGTFPVPLLGDCIEPFDEKSNIRPQN